MTMHRKAVALMDPIEAVARLAARAGERAESAQTRASGSASWDNADGTKTIIGPQAGSGEGAPSGQAIATHVGDTTPPPVPTGITAWSGDGSLHVMWDGTLSGDIPADFDHISILVDGEEVAQLSSAGSVTVGGVEAGATVSVTATAEDDACLADGTPAHNVSAPCAAVSVTIKDAVAEVRADADAHGKQIDAVKQDIAAYKASAEATYATKTEVDERTGAITKTLSADYTRTADLAATEAVKDAKKAGTDAQGQLADYMESNDAAVADAKAAGTGASAALDGYKATVSETYAEKTELTEAVNQLSSTMSSNYTAFTDYRKSNDTALSKAQTDATNAQSTIDSYKTSNDKAVADAKAAGTTAQDQLNSYKSSNDQAVAAARKAGTDAQSQLGSYKAATDQRLTELQNVADNAIESWYLKGAPTTSNAPAKDWTTDALRRQHAGDLYMDTDTGYSYRWSGTEWVQVKDSDVTKALKEIQSVKTDYATKSELSATDTELSGKVSDALTTAKSYTDSSVEQEVTARNAAIKAQADSISLDVSRTYTKSETFSAYQSDADGRIATANANASTAVSTAKTAASDAATAKTNASSAVSTANSASGTASKASTDAAAAVKTANSASSTASSAATTANSAKSTADAASSTASAAQSTADGAAKQANLYTIGLGDAGPVAKWIHLGTLTSAGNASSATISIVFGNGYNGSANQNSALTITIKDGWQSTQSATGACGVTAMRENCDNALVDVLAQSARVYDVWVYAPWAYSEGRYSISGQYAAWKHSGATQKAEPATSATQVKQDVAYRLADATKAQTMAMENQSSIRQLSDSITSEVTERSKLAGRVGTLESTSGTHASKLEQLATSIKSLVKGESTYTDPDGKSATSGIYSLVTQTRDSVTALFGQYTKTADLASTQAVKDAKKAGTDAQAAASAAQSTANSAKSAAQAAASDAATAKTNAASAVSTANSASTSAANAVETANAASSTASSASSKSDSAVSTANAAKTSAASAVSTANAANSTAGAAKTTADSLATLIRADSTGITVGKSADGQTYSTGRTHMDEDSFDVLDKAGNILSSFGKSLIELGKNSANATISMLAGLVKIQARNDGSNTVASVSSDFLSLDSLWKAVMRAGKETGGAHVEGYAAAIAEVTGRRGSARLYCTQGNGSRVTANNAFTVLPDGYDLGRPEYLAAALLGTGSGGGTGITHFQDAVTMASDLDACGPGVFSYNASTANRPTDYGTCVCIRAGDGTDTGTWLFQVALPTSGDPHWRRNINGAGWEGWWTITSQ